MSHPLPDPATAALSRIVHATLTALADRPEMFTSAHLARLRGEALELRRAADQLAEAADGALLARERP